MASGVFKNYPNVKWSAQCKAQAYSGLDLLETTADLNNFGLKEIKSLPNDDSKVMLMGTNNTWVLVTGPVKDLKLMSTKLKEYIGKHWNEIEKFTL